MKQKKWYIVKTSAGFEKSVKTNIERRITSMGMEDYIFEVFIPEVKEIEVRADGKQEEKLKKMFPGYVFVEMIVTDESWFMVRNTPGCTGFLGSSGGGAKPIPLTNDEIEPILKKCGMLEQEVLDANIGDKVNILDGPFVGRNGIIEKILEEEQIVTVSVELFSGRPTSIDLAYNQVNVLRN